MLGTKPGSSTRVAGALTAEPPLQAHITLFLMNCFLQLCQVKCIKLRNLLLRGWSRRITNSSAQPAIHSRTLSQKERHAKNIPQLVWCLLRMQEALALIRSTAGRSEVQGYLSHPGNSRPAWAIEDQDCSVSSPVLGPRKTVSYTGVACHSLQGTDP